MKTHVLTISLIAGALAGGTGLTAAQQPGSVPNPVISSPANGSTSGTSGTETTGSRIESAVENLVGRFLGHNGSTMTLNQAPQAVQNAVRAQAGNAPIQSVSQVTTNGQTAYLVTFNQNGQPVNLQVDPAGHIVNSSGMATPPRAPLAAAAPVAFDQLPAAVQGSLARYSQGAPIQGVERGTVQGQTVYDATFQQHGQPVVLRVDSNGALVRDAMTDQFLAGQGTQPTQPSWAVLGSSRISSPDWRTAPARQPLSEPSPIDFRSLPQPVRDTLNRYAAADAIRSVQMGLVDGQPAYQADIERNGQPITLRLSNNGTLLNDQVNDRFLSEFNSGQNRYGSMGRAPNWQSGGGSSSAAAPLSHPTSVSFDQLPLAVQTTLSGQASGAPVDRVTQGTTFDGKTAYDLTYNQNGQPVTVRISEDGSLLSAPTIAR